MRLRTFKGLVSVVLLSVFFVSCSKEESLELNMPSQPASGGTAVYALSVSGGSCMNADVQGDFKKNVATAAANKVAIEVSVNTIGSWTVNSATITGFYFSGSGSFSGTGTQTIVLNAHGTPTTVGTQTFTLIVGATNCTFEVDVDSTGTGGGTPPPASGEYFPLTQASWWSYDDGTGDTTKSVSSGTATLLGKTFQRFINSYEWTTDTDSSYYRKDNATNSYYLYQDLGDLSSLGLTIAQPKVEVLFLKNVLTTGSSWNNDFPATAGGLPVTIRFKVSCINANASLSVNGNSFTNVYHVQTTVQLGAAGTFTDMASPVNLYFAKGVGMVKTDDGTDISTIRYWHVN